MSVPAITNATQLSQPPKLPSHSPHPNRIHTHFSNPNNNLSNDRKLFFLQHNQPADPTVTWTSSIARRCRNGQLVEAVKEFTHMRISGVEPNYITFVTLLSACENANSPSETLHFGASVHGYTHKLGLDRNNVVVGTAVVDMYLKCTHVDHARKLFDEMCVKNSVSWNTMIDGYMKNGEVEEAIALFDQMPMRDKFSWTALIGGFVKEGYFEEALEGFHQMQKSGVEPDYVTILSVLNACANLGMLGLGLWMHRYILQQDLGGNIRVSNSLIGMYSRCGCIEFAHQKFEKMSKRSLVSWNSIIVGFSTNGLPEEALEHFYRMQEEGFEPDGVSFTGALTACSHAGLVERGLQLFDTMKRIHRIKPRIEHYGCLVDLYSRAGQLEDALHVIESMPVKPNEVVLGSLLAACRSHGELNLAERLMQYLELEPGCDSNYVLLSNIYAAIERWDGVGNVRNRMKALGIKKKPGFSAIEIDCSFHEFVAGDKSHIHSESIYVMLDLLSLELRPCGYVPESIVGGLSEYN